MMQRRFLPIVAVLTIWSLWASGVVGLDLFDKLREGLVMTFTMVFASFVAGATSEGGGAIAFPIMTLILDIEPSIARDFALMIQSVGMGMAAFFIVVKGIKVDWQTIGWGLFGASFGLHLGLFVIAPMLSPVMTKLFFVSIWMSFGIILLNRHDKLSPQGVAQERDPLVMATLGIAGGAITGITGCGLDIILFAYTVLGCGVSPKIATPTSVVMMAVISMMGFLVRGFDTVTPISPDAWTYWWSSVPVVIVGAPLGAAFIANRSKNFIIGLLLTSIVAQFVAALVILPLTSGRIAMVCAVLGLGSWVFHSLHKNADDALPMGSTP